MIRNENQIIRRGDIFMIDFGSKGENLQRGLRPAIVVSNDSANKFAPIITVVPLTSRLKNLSQRTHVVLKSGEGNLKVDSMVLAEQIQSVDKEQVKIYIGTLNQKIMNSVDVVTNIALGKEIDYMYLTNKVSQIDKLLDVFITTMSVGIREVIDQLIIEIEQYCAKVGLNSYIYISKYKR